MLHLFQLLVDPQAIVVLVKTQCSLEELNDVKHSENIELVSQNVMCNYCKAI